MSTLIENLEALLQRGSDTALLRFSLGSAYFGRGDFELAVSHLQRAVELDGTYSAAWKMLGRAQAAGGDAAAAMASYHRGIAVADARGDQQAAREMRVFLRRLGRAAGAGTDC